MSEYSRRYRYLDLRVLISVNDVLGDPRPDMLVHLTGIQASLLRNMCQYLQRQSTFVSQYLDTLYVSPTQEEWDQIEAIVADMEDKLMGNGADVNLHGFDGAAWRKIPMVFGYASVLDVNLGGVATEDPYSANTSAVPAGELWVVTCASGRDITTVCSAILLWVLTAGGAVVILEWKSPTVAAEAVLFAGQLILVAGDTLYFRAEGCAVDDVIQAGVKGYKMRVDL